MFQNKAYDISKKHLLLLNIAVKLNNQCKKDHFDRLNPEKDSKPFWKSCKPYFSNKHSFGDSKIALSENGEFLTENNKIAKTFNSFFETVSDSLNLFNWPSKVNVLSQRHLRFLMMEIYKSISQLNPQFMWSFLTHKDIPYNLRKGTILGLPKISFILLWYECYSFSRFSDME